MSSRPASDVSLRVELGRERGDFKTASNVDGAHKSTVVKAHFGVGAMGHLSDEGGVFAKAGWEQAVADRGCWLVVHHNFSTGGFHQVGDQRGSDVAHGVGGAGDTKAAAEAIDKEARDAIAFPMAQTVRICAKEVGPAPGLGAL